MGEKLGNQPKHYSYGGKPEEVLRLETQGRAYRNLLDKEIGEYLYAGIITVREFLDLGLIPYLIFFSRELACPFLRSKPNISLA